jgi:hypothetical protein
VFLKNQCYDQNFAYFSFVLSQKRQIFSLNFSAKIFLKNHIIGPCSGWRDNASYVKQMSAPKLSFNGARFICNSKFSNLIKD